MMMKTFPDECDLNFSDDVDDVDEVGDVYDVCAI